jgi:hypothetical protein
VSEMRERTVYMSSKGKLRFKIKFKSVPNEYPIRRTVKEGMKNNGKDIKNEKQFLILD